MWLTLMNSAQQPVTFFSLSLTVGPEADDCDKVCKCVSDSRDVSSIVANSEVFLKVHGFVRGAELRNEGETV